MRKVAELLGFSEPTEFPSNDTLPPGFIGLELELEGRRFENVRGWETKNDGSLRGGVEYVFNGPQGGDQALESILNMGEALRVNPPEPTFRCSTHIHLDVRDFPLDRLEYLILAYAYNEAVMFDHCSLERRYSNFCTPYFRNTELARRVTSLYKTFIGTERERLSNLGNWPKYSSLNLAVATRFGSVEFRGSHAMTTSAELIALAQRMLHLRRLALSIEVPDGLSFVERLSNMSLEELFPTGLNPGYVRDEGLSDVCLANSLLIAGTAFGETVEQSRDEAFHESLRAHRAAAARRSVADPNVRFRQSLAQRLCLNVPTTMRLSEVLRLYRALQGIRGVGLISIQDMLQDPREVRWSAVVDQAGRLGFSSATWNMPNGIWAPEETGPLPAFDEVAPAIFFDEAVAEPEEDEDEDE